MTETHVERRSKRWTREEVYRLMDMGLLSEDRDKAPYELLEGELVEKMPENTPHAHASDNTYDALSEVAKPGYFVQGEHPIVLDNLSEPEPGACVVVGNRRDYTSPPRAADIALLVEVCDSTFRDDRRRKVPLYARAKIPEVWLLDLNGRRLLVHTGPEGDEYRLVRTLHEDESVSPAFRPETCVAVADLLP